MPWSASWLALKLQYGDATYDGSRTIGESRERVEPADLREHDLFVALEVGPRVVAPEPGDRRVHESAVEPSDLVEAEPEALGDARPPGLHEHVDVGGEALRDGAVVGIVEIEHDAALAAAPERPGRLRAQR